MTSPTLREILHHYGHSVATGSYSKATLDQAEQAILAWIAEEYVRKSDV